MPWMKQNSENTRRICWPSSDWTKPFPMNCLLSMCSKKNPKGCSKVIRIQTGIFRSRTSQEHEATATCMTELQGEKSMLPINNTEHLQLAIDHTDKLEGVFVNFFMDIWHHRKAFNENHSYQWPNLWSMTVVVSLLRFRGSMPGYHHQYNWFWIIPGNI